MDKTDLLIAKRRGQIPVKPLVDAEKTPEWHEGNRLNTLHVHQLAIWECQKRFLIALAGIRGGKTRLGAYWMLREIQRTAVAGELNHYLIVGPDTEILKKAALPLFSSLVEGLAEYKHVDRCYVFTQEGSRKLTGVVCDIKVFVGYANKPESLQAATYKGVWADEAGQKDFVVESWEAIQYRTSMHKSRVLFTTTPYSAQGWLRDLCDQADGGRDDAHLERFKSIANPCFPRDEYDRMKREMPEWRFKLFCEAEFTRPAGSIYDCFDKRHVVKHFQIPQSWPRHIGVDFGEVNTAAVFLAEDPDNGNLYVYEEYHTGSKSAAEHADSIKTKGGVEDYPLIVGGTWTGEDPGWRREFVSAGLPVARPPIKEVEAGIDRVYRQFKTDRLFVFEGLKLVSEIESYSRDVDDNGEPLQTIADKHKYHRLDALRYIVAALRPMDGQERVLERIKERLPEVEPKDEDAEKFKTNTWVMEQEAKPRMLGQVKVV